MQRYMVCGWVALCLVRPLILLVLLFGFWLSLPPTWSFACSCPEPGAAPRGT